MVMRLDIDDQVSLSMVILSMMTFTDFALSTLRIVVCSECLGRVGWLFVLLF